MGRISDDLCMRDPEATQQEPDVPGQETPPGMISADRALQVILILLTLWTVFSGIALLFFPDNAEATIGGGQGPAAQRLLGVHVLVLAVIYGLLAWNREGYRMLLWIPYAVQAAVVVITMLNIVTGDLDFLDGLLPLAAAATFLTLLVLIWRAGSLDILPESEWLSKFTADDEAVASEAASDVVDEAGATDTPKDEPDSSKEEADS